MAKKITIAENYDLVAKFLADNGAPANLRDFIADRKDKHTKSASTPSKAQTANTEANEKLMADIANGMEVNIEYTVADVMEMVGVSNQKASYLMRKMTNADIVARTDRKGKAYFTLIEN